MALLVEQAVAANSPAHRYAEISDSVHHDLGVPTTSRPMKCRYLDCGARRCSRIAWLGILRLRVAASQNLVPSGRCLLNDRAKITSATKGRSSSSGVN